MGNAEGVLLPCAGILEELLSGYGSGDKCWADGSEADVEKLHELKLQSEL